MMKAIGKWIIDNSDSILKLVGSVAIVFGTLLVANYESKMTAITLINQREQAESELRSNMFSHLITPVVGPYQDSKEIDSHRECVLVKLLALNFHEHFEFKPLMVHVDERLKEKCKNYTCKEKSEEEIEKEKKQAECDRDSLRSIARRVADRQIAMLIKEGAKEPVSLEIKVSGKVVKTDSVQINEDFSDPRLAEKLIKKGIIERDSEDPNFLSFNASVQDEKQLIERLKKAGFEEYGEIKEIWRQHQYLIIPSPDEYPIKAGIKQYIELSPPENKGKSYLRVMLFDVDWENETAEVGYFIKKEMDNEHDDITLQTFTLTWYDFPLTDNTILPDGNRFSILLNAIDKGVSPGEGIVTLKVIWFPKDYFTARERPIRYQEFREKLGI